MDASMYRSLTIDEYQIRVVYLLPKFRIESDRTLKVHIECELRCYEALSYEWGSPRDRRMIFINGRKCLVRANLWSALNRLRNEYTERILWVDALCINQYDTFERNHQVGQMSKIYEQATRVICWIGVDEGVEFPSAHNVDTTEFVPSIAIRTLQALSRSGRRSDQKLPTTGLPYSLLPTSPSRSLESLCRLFYRPYWKRLWIIQELTLAKEILVQCGEYNFEWKDLAQCCDNLEQISEHWLTIRDKKVYRLVCKIKDSIPCRLHRQRKERQTHGEQAHPLLELLFTYSEAQCEDIRDKVFGLHSLAHDCCKREVPVDYGISVLEICSRVLNHHFSEHQSPLFYTARHTTAALHRLLKAPKPDEYLQRKMLNSTAKATLKFNGTLEGTISWLSPASDDLPLTEWVLPHQGHETIIAEVAQIHGKMNEFGFTKNLDTYRLSHIGHAKYSRAIPKGNSYIELDSPITNHISSPSDKPSSSSSNLGNKLLGFASSKIQQAIKWRDLDIMFRKGLDWTPIVGGTDSKTRVRISISSENLLHYVPHNATTGDLMCQIDDSDTILILRWDATGKEGNGRYVVVGRASEVPHAGRREQEISRYGARERVRVWLDAPTLQLLSWEEG
ncbi:hypothetical protein BTUL_0093g00380 [Botrytis tulipae]|uniref:Heterokaryon incompatibility domain-containing protein n=1 Tax=Botrytis tulipae TaxID=87230 RepID=A0A4Z1ELX9_9HELO|nr:hypothetical protein BTUL_0093g00380 [Botrytis tulipae]